jgi:hypothetical protein
MRNVAVNLREAVVPGAGHWLMEENPTSTIALIRNFLKDQTSAAPHDRQADEPPDRQLPALE